MFPNDSFQPGRDADSTNTFMEAAYSELRGIAGYFLARESAEHAMQPAALVNEAYIRISVGVGVQWLDRRHFFVIAARQMQRILIDQGRRRRAAKRAAGIQVDFQEACRFAVFTDCSAPEVEELLDRLRRRDELAAAVVDRKIFGGLTHSELAVEMGCSRSTVKRRWDFAKSWLIDELARNKAGGQVPVGVNSRVNLNLH